MLFGIPILEIELNADGSVRDVSVLRPPANAEAAGFWTARGFRPLLIEAYRAPGESC